MKGSGFMIEGLSVGLGFTSPPPLQSHEASQVQNLALTVVCAIQGYLAYKKPTPRRTLH
jgi:hypothetical protein